ncbi:Uncharacterised protein [uncultured archaeon]|nr:Uncharacterised protein [uncultured archaeon]
MPERKKKEIKKVFAAVYIILTLLLAYLLFFNSGIEITSRMDYATGQKAVFVMNTTDRLINSVTVKYRDGGAEKMLATIAELGPKEKKRLDTSQLPRKKTEFIAEAPFHVAASETIDLGTETGQPIKVSMPQTAETGKPFEFSLEVCNYEQGKENIIVQEIHEPLFFLSQNDEKTLTLGQGECQTIKYGIVPGKKGETTIYFNVNFPNSNEQFQRSVSVR